MPAVELSNICKSYNGNLVVDNVSFTVEKGEIFGLIGPNGAGKTSTIRMMMDITKPESGEIIILGESLNETTKNKVGYLPEERGLYKKITALESIIYLASLKGMGNQAARTRAEELLQRVDMQSHQGKKIEELSRGMGQIIQFLTTIIHDPQLLILDEPFTALDPVNTKLLKEIILELRNQGKAIILSTHMMNEVEALCDRILMINKGQTVLYGELSEIKSRYRNNSIFLKSDGVLGEIKGVVEKKAHGDYVELFLDGETPPQEILQYLVNHGVQINQFEVSSPPLNEIFLRVVGKGQ